MTYRLKIHSDNDKKQPRLAGCYFLLHFISETVAKFVNVCYNNL